MPFRVGRNSVCLFVHLSILSPSQLLLGLTLRTLWMALSLPCLALIPYGLTLSWLAVRLLQLAQTPYKWPSDPSYWLIHSCPVI